MKVQAILASALFATSSLGGVVKREQFNQGQPIDDKGKGAPILGIYFPGSLVELDFTLWDILYAMILTRSVQVVPIARLTSPTLRI